MRRFDFLRYRIFAMLPYLAVSLVIWPLCIFSAKDASQISFYDLFLNAMGGVEHSGILDLFGLLRFFGSFFAGIFLGMAATTTATERMSYLIIVREKNFFSWWQKLLSSMLLWSLMYSAVGLIICAVFSDRQSLSTHELLTLAAYPSAMCVSMCLMCLLRFLIGQKRSEAAVIAVLAVSGLAGGKLKHFDIFMFGVYGMAKQLTTVKELAAVLIIDWITVLLVRLCSCAVRDRLGKGGHYFD